MDRDEVIRQRPDLVELRREWQIDKIVQEETPLRWVNNFLGFFLINDGLGKRKNRPEIAQALDAMIVESDFDISEYQQRTYWNEPQAHERAYPFYVRLHDEHGFSWELLYQ